MSNIYFQQKIASDELRDTLFFCSGVRPSRMRSADGPTLSIPDRIKVSVKSFKHILVNGDRCKSVYEAKLVIMDELL